MVVISLLGTIFFSLYYLCLAEPLNKLQINWLMVVSPGSSSPSGSDCSPDFFQEFWFTAGATFFYFTAFVSLLSGFVGYEDEEWQYWIDANIAAGVSFLANTGEREMLGI